MNAGPRTPAKPARRERSAAVGAHHRHGKKTRVTAVSVTTQYLHQTYTRPSSQLHITTTPTFTSQLLHRNYIVTSQLHRNYATTTSQLHHNYITTTSQLPSYITATSQLHHNYMVVVVANSKHYISHITTTSQLHHNYTIPASFTSELHRGGVVVIHATLHLPPSLKSFTDAKRRLAAGHYVASSSAAACVLLMDAENQPRLAVVPYFMHFLRGRSSFHAALRRISNGRGGSCVLRRSTMMVS